MRFLVIYCHPVETRFCNAIHQTVITSLTASGHEVSDVDLYADNFQPVLTRQERIAYFAPGYADDIQKYADALHWAEGLVFVYPTWWYNLPAMLKGWLDRVWLPDITFSLKSGPQPLVSHMTHIRRLIGVTTYGSPWWLIKVSGEPGRKTLMRGMRALCHPRCKTTWLALYKMDHATLEQRQSFLAKLERRLLSL